MDDFQIAGGPSIPTVHEFLAAQAEDMLDLDKRWNRGGPATTNLSSELSPHRLRAKSASSRPVHSTKVSPLPNRMSPRKLQKFIVQMKDNSDAPPTLHSR